MHLRFCRRLKIPEEGQPEMGHEAGQICVVGRVGGCWIPSPGGMERRKFFFFKLLEVCAAVGFSHHLT